MKVYEKLVEILADIMLSMIAFSEFTYKIVLAMFDISAELLEWGRLVTLFSIIFTVIAGEISILSAPSQRWLSIDLLTPEQSRYLMIGALLFLAIVLVLRFLSLLVWDATKKMVGRK